MSTRERLIQLIRETGISQAELARRVGEHPTWVNNRLRGVAIIKADDVPRLARGLGIHPADFFPEPTWQVRPLAEGVRSRPAPFPEDLAAVWEDMTDAERELVEQMIRSTQRYRERLLRESSQHPGEAEPGSR